MTAAARQRVRPMNEPAAASAALKAMRDDIYRQKILRARKLTPEQRLAEFVTFDAQVSFDTLAWGKRDVGTS